MIATYVEALAVQTSAGEHVGAPLLVQLRNAVFGNMGRTRARASDPSSRVPIDIKAFSLYERIDGEIASLFAQATVQVPHSNAETNLLAWYAAFSAADQRSEISPLMLEVATDRVRAWAHTISDYFDGPIVKELLIECPRCGEMFTEIGEGEAATRVVAITVTLREGEEIDAVCAKCGTRWVGRTEVVHLGRLAGLTIDADAIREALIPHET